MINRTRLALEKFDALQIHVKSGSDLGGCCAAVTRGDGLNGLCARGRLLFGDWQEQENVDDIVAAPRTRVITVTWKGTKRTLTLGLEVDVVEVPLGTEAVEDNRGGRWERHEMSQSGHMLWVRLES